MPLQPEPPDGEGTLSEREELDALRKAVAQLRQQRDLLGSSAAALIKQASRR